MCQPSRPVTVGNPYRIPPKLVDQGLGGAANPGGDDDGADKISSSVSKTKKPFDQKTNRFEDPSLYMQKEKVLEQCDLEEESQETTETTSDLESEEKQCEATEQFQVDESYKSNSSLKKSQKKPNKTWM